MEEYELQPLEAVAAVASRELSTLARSVERSKNIKGDIVKDLWGVFTKLSAALTITTNRASEAVTADEEDDRVDERAWTEERRRLKTEIASLRTENARLIREAGWEKRSPPPLGSIGADAGGEGALRRRAEPSESGWRAGQPRGEDYPRRREDASPGRGHGGGSQVADIQTSSAGGSTANEPPGDRKRPGRGRLSEPPPRNKGRGRPPEAAAMGRRKRG